MPLGFHIFPMKSAWDISVIERSQKGIVVLTVQKCLLRVPVAARIPFPSPTSEFIFLFFYLSPSIPSAQIFVPRNPSSLPHLPSSPPISPRKLPQTDTHRKMSQKREEETLELKVPAEALTLCPENCKISSNSATTTTAISPASSSCTSQINDGSSSGPTKIGGNSSDEGGHRPEKSPEKQGVAAEVDREAPAKKEVNRCLGCKRRVGLTGFRCRCGELFCWEHRYSDRHDCSYDYKAAGRLAIARENPLVRAAKILKV